LATSEQTSRTTVQSSTARYFKGRANELRVWLMAGKSLKCREFLEDFAVGDVYDGWGE
jgi:hypothetical protein